MADSQTRKAKVPIAAVPQDSGWYDAMRDLIEKHHTHLSGDSADIALMWHMTKKADSDGNLTPAWAKKTSELDRQRDASGRDFVVFLCHDVYSSGDFSEQQGKFWLDMALESCKPVLKSDGEQKLTEDNEYVWRIANAPVKVFPEVVARHGPLDEALAILRNVLLDNADRDRALLRMMESSNVEPEPETDEERQRSEEDKAVEKVLAAT